MKSAWIATAALGAAMASGACGSSTDGGAGGPTGSVELDELPPLVAEALCTAYERCLGPLAAGTFVTQDCVGEQTKAFEDGSLNDLKKAVEGGKATYDPAKAGACLDAIKGLSCSSFDLDTVPACNDAVKGTVADGGDCESDEECAAVGSHCAIEAACPGKCTAGKPAGSPCETEEQCASGLECTVAGTCAKPAARGEACEGDTSPSCQIGLACVGSDSGSPGTCREPSDLFSEPVGSPCDLEASTLCVVGASCVVTGIGANGITSECKAGVASGAACNLGAPDVCPDDEVCNLTIEQLMTGQTEGKCVPLPGAGQPCSEAFGAPSCSSGNRCVEGRCVAIQRIGGKCTDDSACYSDRCANGTCQAPDACAR